MSASLVGSEMCIRDRTAGAYWRIRPPGAGPPPRPMGGGQLEPPPMGLGAVSYTHLTLPTICSV
eukprot:2453965-Alexandrium_andersonii.AAC.1